MARPFATREIGELLDEHDAALQLYATQWTHLAEDCVQEAFIALASQTQRPPNPVAWLYRVVRNRASNASRSARRRVNHERLASMLIDATEADPTHFDELDELREALGGLPETDRELVVLRIWSQLTWHQIAGITGIAKSSAQRKYVAALQRLKEILEPCPKNSNCPKS